MEKDFFKGAIKIFDKTTKINNRKFEGISWLTDKKYTIELQSLMYSFESEGYTEEGLIEDAVTKIDCSRSCTHSILYLKIKDDLIPIPLENKVLAVSVPIRCLTKHLATTTLLWKVAEDLEFSAYKEYYITLVDNNISFEAVESMRRYHDRYPLEFLPEPIEPDIDNYGICTVNYLIVDSEVESLHTDLLAWMGYTAEAFHFKSGLPLIIKHPKDDGTYFSSDGKMKGSLARVQDYCKLCRV